jgi:molybdate transport system regulatory protein
VNRGRAARPAGPRRDARRPRASGRLWLRIELGDGHRLGPGKVQLLERIDEHGSISAAGRSMQMSYRRAWLLVESINACFREPAVLTQQGGSLGGGAVLTDLGREIVRRYREIERRALAAASEPLGALAAQRSTREAPPTARGSRRKPS